eukprot:3936030-Pyramimonas_sp.AAC.1
MALPPPCPVELNPFAIDQDRSAMPTVQCTTPEYCLDNTLRTFRPQCVRHRIVSPTFVSKLLLPPA